MSESVILCEGYHDRAFWKGWLLCLGCTDPGIKPGKSTRADVLDPWKTKVAGGQFAFHTKQGRFVRIVPCGGKDQILRVARDRLAQVATKPCANLVLNVDADTNADGTPVASGSLAISSILGQARQFDPNCQIVGPTIPLAVGTAIHLIKWETTEPDQSGLPNQQTLERLVCASICAAYPNRRLSVQNWLDSRPGPPGPSPKENAWSLMAGWYADQGCEAFYSCLWDDPEIAKNLEARLRSSGAWQILEQIASA